MTEKHLTDEDIQQIKNTLQKHGDIKSPIELMTQSLATEQERELIKTMFFRFTDYVIQKQRADELEDMLNEEVEERYQMENRWRTEIERADELEKRLNEVTLAPTQDTVRRVRLRHELRRLDFRLGSDSKIYAWPGEVLVADIGVDDKDAYKELPGYLAISKPQQEALDNVISSYLSERGC